MKDLLIGIGLVAIGTIIVSVGIVLNYEPFTIYLTCLLTGATLGYVKGKFFYET